MSKDFSKYRFKDHTYNKRRLVEAVVKDYLNSHKTITFSELQKVFPAEIQQQTKIGISSIAVIEKVENIPQWLSKKFFDEEITLSDNTKIQIYGGWDVDNIVPFIKRAIQLGYKIEKIGERR